MAIQLSYLEKDVEDLLESACGHYLGLRFLKRQFKTPVGVVDTIAYWKGQGAYFVIEIKKGPLDASSFVQVLRYTNWLNSELTKGGRRLFIPLLIGDRLGDDLVRLCEYLDLQSLNRYESLGRVFYRLFDFDPYQGVTFEWHSPAERNHRASLMQRHSHIGRILEATDQLLDELYEEKRQRANDESAPSLTLVKSGDAA